MATLHDYNLPSDWSNCNGHDYSGRFPAKSGGIRQLLFNASLPGRYFAYLMWESCNEAVDERDSVENSGGSCIYGRRG